jgi:hypothetical protein
MSNGLATSIVGSAGIVTARDRTVRKIASDVFFFEYEIIDFEVREWVALTQAAATTAVTSGAGHEHMSISAGTFETIEYSDESYEVARSVKSYTYRCRAEKKTISWLPPSS